jgi:murein L,D-transpeptidase YcbB/YkuD
MNSAKSLKLLNAFRSGLLILILASSANASALEVGLLSDQVTNLLNASQKQGLVTGKYQAAAAKLKEYVSLSQEIEAQKQFSDIVKIIASDLATGQVKASQLRSRSIVPIKKMQPMQTDAINLYLAGRISAEDLILSVIPSNPYYSSLVNRLQKLQSVVKGVSRVPAPANLMTIKPGVKDASSILYARYRLALLGYDNDNENPILTSELTNNIVRFQENQNLVADGILGPASWSILNQDINSIISQLRINIDRARWLPDSLGVNHVFVNLAQQQLKLTLNNQVTMEFRTINGRSDRPTPILFDSMNHLILNPTWTVPQTILFKDKLPLFIENPQKVIDLKMQVYDDLTNLEVDPLLVDWSKVSVNYSPYTVVQRPGKNNALGFVKFPLLKNPWAIYLHDTDSRGLFENPTRLLSSGCVRLEKPFEFAEAIMNSVQWNAEKLRNASEYLLPEATTPTRINLGRTLPVYLFYLTTVVGADDEIILLKDTYGIDNNMYEILSTGLSFLK